MQALLAQHRERSRANRCQSLAEPCRVARCGQGREGCACNCNAKSQPECAQRMASEAGADAGPQPLAAWRRQAGIRLASNTKAGLLARSTWARAINLPACLYSLPGNCANHHPNQVGMIVNANAPVGGCKVAMAALRKPAGRFEIRPGKTCCVTGPPKFVLGGHGR